jgi:hypothetical protein
MTATTSVGEGGEVSRDDIEAKLRELRGEVDAVGESGRNTIGIVLVGVVVAVVAVTYLLGKRKGRRKTTVVEVRRI